MRKKRGRKTILIVPPQAKSVKSLRLQLLLGLLFLSLVVIGYAGLLFPFSDLSLDIAEQNHRNNLIRQNRLLADNIDSSLILLGKLREQVTKLENKRDMIHPVASLPDDALVDEHNGDGYSEYLEIEHELLLQYLSGRFEILHSFIYELSKDQNLFERVPVCWPIPDYAHITRRFGEARDPFTGKQKMHHGIDFAAQVGTPVIATASGVVARVENDPVWGRRITINHQDGFRTVYAHLGSVQVGRGRRVRRGDVIGTIGLSGLTTGPHVHYELWRNNKQVDPEDFFFPQVEFSGREVYLTDAEILELYLKQSEP